VAAARQVLRCSRGTAFRAQSQQMLPQKTQGSQRQNLLSRAGFPARQLRRPRCAAKMTMDCTESRGQLTARVSPQRRGVRRGWAVRQTGTCPPCNRNSFHHEVTKSESGYGTVSCCSMQCGSRTSCGDCSPVWHRPPRCLESRHGADRD
jgi:hypothetical protein